MTDISQDIAIVSHPLCPMSQRLALVAAIGGGEVRITRLPYATLGRDAPLHSPTGELPVMKLDGEVASTATEHAAEYLDGRFGGGLIPADPKARLEARTAERAASAALDALRAVFTARDAAGLQAACDGFFGAVRRVESVLPPHAPGDLSRMDLVALAPMASLTGAFPALRDHDGWGSAPRVKAHLDACRADPRVTASQCPDYAAEFDGFFAMTGSAFPLLAR